MIDPRIPNLGDEAASPQVMDNSGTEMRSMSCTLRFVASCMSGASVLWVGLKCAGVLLQSYLNSPCADGALLHRLSVGSRLEQIC